MGFLLGKGLHFNRISKLLGLELDDELRRGVVGGVTVLCTFLCLTPIYHTCFIMTGVHDVPLEVLLQCVPFLTHLPLPVARLIVRLVHRIYLPSRFRSAALAPDLL